MQTPKFGVQHGIGKHQLITELGFINKFFNFLIEMKAPKLWEEQNV